MQPVKVKASKAEALIRPNVRRIVRSLIVVLTPARRKSFYWRALSLRCMELGRRLFAANILRRNGADDHAKGGGVGVKFYACKTASPRCARMT